jgi:hypothetical protein
VAFVLEDLDAPEVVAAERAASGITFRYAKLHPDEKKMLDAIWISLYCRRGRSRRRQLRQTARDCCRSSTAVSPNYVPNCADLT